MTASRAPFGILLTLDDLEDCHLPQSQDDYFVSIVSCEADQTDRSAIDIHALARRCVRTAATTAISLFPPQVYEVSATPPFLYTIYTRSR